MLKVMVKKHAFLATVHVPYVLSALIMVVGVLSFLALRSIAVTGQTIEQCPPSMAIIVEPPHGEVLSGVEPLKVAYMAPNINELDRVRMKLDQDGIGDAEQISGASNIWELEWDTTSADNGVYAISARLLFTEGNDCVTKSVPVVIDNQTSSATSELVVELNPDEWFGPTNVNFGFQAVALLIDNAGNATNVTANTAFTWSTTIGSVSSTSTSWGDFFSGPAAGIGEIEVFGEYGTQSDFDDAVIEIYDNPSNYSYPIIDDDSSGRDHNDSDDDGTETPASRDTGQGDISLALCIEERLQTDEYKQLIDSKSRLSPEQFDRVWTCFAERQFVIPANLTPVNPDDVVNLGESARLKISEIINVDRGEGQVALVFSGVADPGQSVLIYVFSEPLVLTTQAGEDGRWTYTLEDPLAPGDHEAYILVESNGEYNRSGSFGFAIAQASATGDNPNGYGLTLVSASDSNRTTVFYIVGVASVVLVASVFLTRFVWFRKKSSPEDNSGGDDTPLGLNDPTPPEHEAPAK